MEIKKIPTLNEEFDISILLKILRKNAILYVFLLLLSIIGGFIYLRYTPPNYKSVSILQINKETDQTSVLNLENVYGNTSMQNLIELLRSKEFLKRIIGKLPLKVNYFAKGTFLDSELYKKSPFFVEYRNLRDYLNGVDISIDFKDESTYTISYRLGGNPCNYTLKTNQWNSINGAEIYVNVSQFASIKERQESLKRDSYYFRILDDDGAFNLHMRALNIRILSSSANTIEVSYTGTNAQKTSDIVNAIAEGFLVYNVEKKQERAEKILAFIEEQLVINYEELNETEREILRLKKLYNLDEDVLDEDPLFSKENLRKREEYQEYYNKMNTMKVLMEQLSSRDSLNIPEVMALMAESESMSMVFNFLNSIQKLQEKRENLLQYFTENNKNVKEVDKDIDNQIQLLANVLSSSLANMEEEISKINFDAEQQTLEKNEISGYDEIEFSKLLRMRSIHNELYNQLVDKKAQYLISKAGHVSQNLILEKSQVPSFPIFPIGSTVHFFSIIIALVVVVLITIIKYLLHNEINTIQDIKNYTTAPVLGTIPFNKNSKQYSHLLVENKSTSLFTESLRSVRSNLDFLQKNSGSKIIAISSTISGEGKTFVAINLAGVLAFSGKKVVLVDMDLRKPKVHLGFDVNNDIGMSTVLIGRNNLEECIKNSDIKGFDFITSGPLPPNPSELAMSDDFDLVLSSLKEKYDVILIDTPPIGIVSDAISSYRRADVPLYIAKAGYSKKNFINNLNYLLEEKEIPTISVILNGGNVSHSRYGYGYTMRKYGYGYGYGYGYSSGYYTKEDDVSEPFYIRLFKLFKKDK